MAEKLALITGAAGGLGAAFVRGFAAAGYRVAFTDLELGAGAAALEAEGDGIKGFACDAGDADQVAGAQAAVEAHFGAAPDVLVNNAGVQTWAGFLDLAVEDFDRVIRTNLRGTFLHTQVAARAMRNNGKGGAIINLGSGCNKLGFPRLVDYSAAKGGIEQLTKTAAMELGPFGIRVNCLAPGAIATERTALEAEDYGEKWAALTPLGRVGTPDDLVGPMLFLASDAAAFVTGQTLYVDGGVFSRAPWPDNY